MEVKDTDIYGNVEGFGICYETTHVYTSVMNQHKPITYSWFVHILCKQICVPGVVINHSKSDVIICRTCGVQGDSNVISQLNFLKENLGYENTKS